MTEKQCPEFRRLGRLLVRDGKTAGLFIPFTGGLEQGVYELREVMGIVELRLIGDPAMPSARYNALGLNELYGERAWAGLTQEEVNQITRTA